MRPIQDDDAGGAVYSADNCRTGLDNCTPLFRHGIYLCANHQPRRSDDDAPRKPEGRASNLETPNPPNLNIICVIATSASFILSHQKQLMDSEEVY
jgi:hypothetical protein